jgi:hypothetical protein
MTAPLTVKVLNCGNCTIPHKVVNGLSRHPKFYCNDVELPISTYQSVCERGCCTNPLALQVLAHNAVEELTRRISVCESVRKELSIDSRSYSELRSAEKAFSEAIKLLKGDTK